MNSRVGLSECLLRVQVRWRTFHMPSRVEFVCGGGGVQACAAAIVYWEHYTLPKCNAEAFSVHASLCGLTAVPRVNGPTIWAVRLGESIGGKMDFCCCIP